MKILLLLSLFSFFSLGTRFMLKRICKYRRILWGEAVFPKPPPRHLSGVSSTMALTARLQMGLLGRNRKKEEKRGERRKVRE